MAILKVDVGAPVTMTVDGVDEVPGKFGPQLKFTSDSGDALFIGLETAQRQLARIGMPGHEAIGKTLLFEKVQKDSKTFININPAKQGSEAKGAGGAGTGATSSGVAQARERPPARPLAPLYNQCLIAAKGLTAQHFGGKATPADVIAATATLFIQASRGDNPLYLGDTETAEHMEDVEDHLPF